MSDGTTKADPGYACCTSATFENVFTLPPNAVSALITISVLADNGATALINGSPFGAQPLGEPWSNFACPASTFRASFTPDPSGTNRLQVILRDDGGALGLDYRATIIYWVQPTNDTPPVITPTVTGTLGANGWYTSDVGVSWNLTDPDHGGHPRQEPRQRKAERAPALRPPPVDRAAVLLLAPAGAADPGRPAQPDRTLKPDVTICVVSHFAPFSYTVTEVPYPYPTYP